MTQAGGISSAQLKQFIERVERLELEKANLAEDIKEVFAEARYNGFDPKIMKTVIKIRKMNADEREEQEHLLDTYMHALGMAPPVAGQKAPAAPAETEETTAEAI